MDADPLVVKLKAVPCPGCGHTPPVRVTLECGVLERGAWGCPKCGWQAPECALTWEDGLIKWNSRFRVPETMVSKWDGFTDEEVSALADLPVGQYSGIGGQLILGVRIECKRRGLTLKFVRK